MFYHSTTVKKQIKHKIMKTFIKWLFVSFSIIKTALLNILKSVNSLFKNKFLKVYRIIQKLLVIILHKLVHHILINTDLINEIITNTSNSEITSKYSLIDISLALTIHLGYLLLKGVYNKSYR